VFSPSEIHNSKIPRNHQLLTSWRSECLQKTGWRPSHLQADVCVLCAGVEIAYSSSPLERGREKEDTSLKAECAKLDLNFITWWLSACLVNYGYLLQKKLLHCKLRRWKKQQITKSNYFQSNKFLTVLKRWDGSLQLEGSYQVFRKGQYRAELEKAARIGAILFFLQNWGVWLRNPTHIIFSFGKIFFINWSMLRLNILFWCWNEVPMISLRLRMS
jgi:hypothetical protein